MILFGLQLQADKKGRIVALVFSSLILTMHGVITWVELKRWIENWKKKGKKVNRPAKKRHGGKDKRKKRGRFRQRWVPVDVGREPLIFRYSFITYLTPFYCSNFRNSRVCWDIDLTGLYPGLFHFDDRIDPQEKWGATVR